MIGNIDAQFVFIQPYRGYLAIMISVSAMLNFQQHVLGTFAYLNLFLVEREVGRA